MNATAFRDWWQELETDLESGVDAYEASARLRRRLQSLPATERTRRGAEVLRVLLGERRAYGVALFLLEGLTDRSLLATIASSLEPLPERCDEEEQPYLADLIRLLAAGDRPTADVVRGYLLERPVDPHWSTVPWALWPHEKPLFAQAWSRFFREQDPADWAGSLVVKPFLSEAEAIVLVRDRLRETAPERWNALRDALARQAGMAGWLSTGQRAALERALG